MSAVDAPPGLAISDLAAGELGARSPARRLARRGLIYVLVVGGVTLALATRRLHVPMIEFLFVAPLVCMSVAAVGHAVRSARLRIDPDGVRWGWHIAGFRMHRDRIRAVTVYSDAVALRPNRGSTWYLARRDWDHFERITRAFSAASIPFERHQRRAPLRSRLQGYGLVLDGLLVANILAATMTLFITLVM